MIQTNIFEFLRNEDQQIQNILLNFKTKKCTNTEEHAKDVCDYYHSEKDMRRAPLHPQQDDTFIYENQSCEKLECNNADCQKYHNNYEKLFHPLNYKTELCEQGQNCQKNPIYCPYYHSKDDRRNLQEGNSKNQETEQKQQVPNILENQIQIPIQDTKNFADNNNNSPKSQKKHENAFDFNTFKTQQCQNKNSHSLKHCIYYHGPQDQRRDLSLYKYSSEKCPEGKNCKLGVNCPKSHNKVEQVYHYDRYKSKFCIIQENYQILKELKGSDVNQLKFGCEYGEYCSFAHSEEELRVPLIQQHSQGDNFNIWKYKTVWCPFTITHCRSSCVYAHNVQDYRRDPALYDIGVEVCDKWEKNETIKFYHEGNCPKHRNCNKCHGWKENEYHPLVYKTKQCTNGSKCTKNNDCAFYHDNDKNPKDINQIQKKKQEIIKEQIEYYKIDISQYDPENRDQLIIEELRRFKNVGQPLQIFQKSPYKQSSDGCMKENHPNNNNGNNHYKKRQFFLNSPQVQHNNFYQNNQQRDYPYTDGGYSQISSTETPDNFSKGNSLSREQSVDSQFYSTEATNNSYQGNMMYQMPSQHKYRAYYPEAHSSDSEIEKKKFNKKIGKKSMNPQQNFIPCGFFAPPLNTNNKFYQQNIDISIPKKQYGSAKTTNSSSLQNNNFYNNHMQSTAPFPNFQIDNNETKTCPTSPKFNHIPPLIVNMPNYNDQMYPQPSQTFTTFSDMKYNTGNMMGHQQPIKPKKNIYSEKIASQFNYMNCKDIMKRLQDHQMSEQQVKAMNSQDIEKLMFLNQQEKMNLAEVVKQIQDQDDEYDILIRNTHFSYDDIQKQ